MITTSTISNSNFNPQVTITPNFPTFTPIIGDSYSLYPGPGFDINISSDTTNNDWYINVYHPGVVITNINIKAIEKKNSQVPSFYVYEEKDGYTFSVKKINKKIEYKNVDGKRKYDYTKFKYEIKLINSPFIKFDGNTPPNLYVKFQIYYILNGEEKRITLYRKRMESNGVSAGMNNGEIIYNSKSYTDRINWANALKLDCIYRPFFFNTALLFSGSTAQLFFSIANGCTYRRDYTIQDSPQGGLQTKYEIGDINLKISHHDEKGARNGDMYELIAKNNYRNFSEIIYYNDDDDDTIKEAHIRGIRGSGIYLPKIDSTKNLDVEHIYTDTYINKYSPIQTRYYNNKYEFTTDYSNYYNITSSTSGDCENFTTSGYGLNVSFSVNDGAPDGVSYKTIGVEYSDIRFPNTIKKDGKNLSFDYKIGWDDNIRYFSFDEAHIIDSLKKINVDDDTFFTGLTDNKYLTAITFNYNGDMTVSASTNSKLDKVLAIYFNGENDINEEENDEGNKEDSRLFKYIKDTSKLLIMRIYNLQENG